MGPLAIWIIAMRRATSWVRVNENLSVPGCPEIFVIGDTASLMQDGKPLPGVAQVAMQQGKYDGKLIRRRLDRKSAPKPFRYFDKGNMAVIGKGYAILQSGKIQLSGFLAWQAWATIHILYLAQRGLRLSVFLQWIWTYFTGGRGSRLIVNPRQIEPVESSPTDMPAPPPPEAAAVGSHN